MKDKRIVIKTYGIKSTDDAGNMLVYSKCSGGRCFQGLDDAIEPFTTSTETTLKSTITKLHMHKVSFVYFSKKDGEEERVLDRAEPFEVEIVYHL